MLKRCSRCSHEAEVSIVCVISTVGFIPRRQKCSVTVLFCHRCFGDLLAKRGRLFTDDLHNAVNGAYTCVRPGVPPSVDPK
jgi:hypothetical protein